MRKIVFITLTLIIIVVQGCVKNRIDLDKLSGQVGFSPGYVLAAVKGDVTLGDIVEPNDTIVFDDLGLMKIVYTEDSIISYSVSDFYTSFPDGSFSELIVVPPTTQIPKDTIIDLTPDNNIELKEMSVITGEINYTITSTCNYQTTLDIIFPSIDAGGSALTETVVIGPNGTVTGQLDIDATLIDFTTDMRQEYNRIPFSLTITPGGIPSDTPGTVLIDVSLSEPEFDYIKGYFGSLTEESVEETIDLDMEDLFSRITGDFELSNPILRVSYRNSFGFPLRVEALATGKNSTEEVDLERDPEDLLYPTTLDPREVEGILTVDRTNSELPALVSMLPNEIIFSGSAVSNPLGDTGTDNIIFGDSRFEADVEIEVPMEFWINNLQLKDTVDNFFLNEDGEDSPLEMLNSLELRMYIKNGFPLGGDISLTLYDSISATPLSSLTTDTFFEPAEVDSNGRVISFVEKSTIISLTDQFLQDAGDADKMIVSFTLFTTNNGPPPVKIYSDYSIVFKAGLSFKADFDLNFNDESNE